MWGYDTPTQPPHMKPPQAPDSELQSRITTKTNPHCWLNPTHIHNPVLPPHTHTHTHTYRPGMTLSLFHRKRQVWTASTNHIVVLQRARPLLLVHISIPLCFSYISMDTAPMHLLTITHLIRTFPMVTQLSLRHSWQESKNIHADIIR